MRIEYNFGLDKVGTPCFSVESIEGPHKLFTLATLILNVIAARPRVDVIFHSPNQADLPRKVAQFEKILASAPSAPEFRLEEGNSGSLGSSYYVWISIHAA
ncbi:MAG: hypothetical protein V3V67_14895 [Myxococcota bacterium]